MAAQGQAEESYTLRFAPLSATESAVANAELVREVPVRQRSRARGRGRGRHCHA